MTRATNGRRDQRAIARQRIRDRLQMMTEAVRKYEQELSEKYDELSRQLERQIEPLILAVRQRDESLRRARPKGAAANKTRAADYHAMWRQMSADLYRNHPTWTLDNHVDYIQKNAAGKKK